MTAGPLLHADADSFFASVVLRERPDLVERPMAVVAHVFIASANYPARARGVRGGTTVQDALRACPELVLVEVPTAAVEDAADALLALFRDVAVAVEPGSVEEAFLDVGAEDWNEAAIAARSVRRRARDELGLPVSVGVGRTKLMAKLASRRAKPDGLLVVGTELEHRLRTSLPVEDVWGIGAKTLERLRQLGVGHLGELAGVSDGDLRSTCGTAMFRRLRAIQHGTDDSRVRALGDRTSMSTETTTAGYQRPDRSPAELVEVCVQRLCHRLQGAGLVARVLTVTLHPEGPGPALTLRHARLDATADPDVWAEVTRDLLQGLELPDLSGARLTASDLSGTGAGVMQDTLF